MTMPNSYKLALNIVSFTLLAAACAVHVYYVRQFNLTQDDAFITFRYAANFLNGHGLVYNIGEQIEGYTNFLWTILMILGGRAGLDFVLWSKILGVACSTSTLIILFLLARKIFDHTSANLKQILSGFCCLLVGASYSYAYWAASGLETAAFALAVTASVYLYVRNSYLMIPCLVWATLLRPEGALVFVIILTAELITGRSLTRRAAAYLTLYTLFLIPLAIFKLAYFGALLPNPFYAKTSFNGQQVLDGLTYTGQFFWHYLGAGVFVIPALIASRKASRPMQAIMILVGIYILYITLIGGDVLKVHRFFVPILPLIILIVVLGLSTVLKWKPILIASLLMILVWQLIMPYNHVHMFLVNEKSFMSKMSKVTRALKSSDSSDFSIALSTIGIAGYELLGHTVIDMLGLTDSTIARHPEEKPGKRQTTWLENKFNSAYLLFRQPDYILFSTGIKPSAPAERSLFRYGQFLDKYRVIPFQLSGKVNHVYKRYFSIDIPVRKNVPAEFELYYSLGIDLWRKRDYSGSLQAFEQARRHCPPPAYPYILYFESLAYEQEGQTGKAYAALKKLAQDTLVFEGFHGLYIYDKGLGLFDDVRRHRERIASLAPWYLPYID
ncbi:MAG: tetratricopeptide repeat protein [FCB group bacterium]|nr:tetratricopeptide repeat protein [FCB group bacterium]